MLTLPEPRRTGTRNEEPFDRTTNGSRAPVNNPTPDPRYNRKHFRACARDSLFWGAQDFALGVWWLKLVDGIFHTVMDGFFAAGFWWASRKIGRLRRDPRYRRKALAVWILIGTVGTVVVSWVLIRLWGHGLGW